MRLLLPALASAYGFGLLLGDLGAGPGGAWLWLGAQLLALGAVSGARVRLTVALLASIAAGATASALQKDEARRIRLAEPVEAVIEARVAAVTGAASGLEAVLAEARAVRPPALRVPERILVRAQPATADVSPWRIGSWVRVALRFAPVRGRTNPGGRDPARTLGRRGIGALAREVDPLLRAEIAAPPARAGLEALARARRRGAERLAREGPGGGLLAALGLGEAGALGASARRDLARLGLSHLVAVSGLHLWLVAGPVYLASQALLRRSAWLAARGDARRGAVAAALAAGAGYAVFTGLAAPVQRALVFLLLLAAAQLARRRLVAPVVFAAAALAVAVADPAAPFAPGVQLSFVATAALVWSAPGPERTGHSFAAAARAGLIAALRVSASATAATAPLVALHFGTVSPLGWLANGIAVPLTSFVFLPLALAAGGAAVVAPDVEAGASALGIARASQLADASLAAVARLAAAAPAWSGVAPGAFGLAVSAGLAAACIGARATWLRLALAFLAASAPALGPTPALRPAPPRAVFLDVGQGDAVLVQGRAASVLVDGGVAVEGRFDAGERVVLPALGALGVGALDLVVASHADLDHTGGLPAVLRALPVRRLWLPPGGRDDPAFAVLREVATARGVAIEERAAQDPVRQIGDLRIETLWPARGARPPSRNDASLVLRIHAGGRRVLLPGDLEQRGERGLAAAELRSDLLKLGHHGSRTSSSRAFLRAVSPALAIVSAPRHGRFGMPHREVVERLAAEAIPWRWTGRDGALLVGLGPSLCVRAFAADAGPGQAGADGSTACRSLNRSSSSRPAGSTAAPSKPPAAPRSR
jgi:competence protein ComEC